MYEVRLKCRECKTLCAMCDSKWGQLLAQAVADEAGQERMRQTFELAKTQLIDHPIWCARWETVSLRHLPTGAVESYSRDASCSEGAVLAVGSVETHRV